MRRGLQAVRRFDLIAFDWDGTLFDSTRLIVQCIQRACVDVGMPRPSDERAAYVIGLGLVDALRHAAPGLPEERYGELGRSYRRHYLAGQNEVTLFDGTRPMLQALRRRHHLLAVATGKSRAGLADALSYAQLGPQFDATRTAEETASKPDPRMLFELMTELGVPPERTLMIGDTTHDLQLAANAGVAAVAVGFGAHDDAQLRRYAPLYIAPSTAALHAWLLEHG